MQENMSGCFFLNTVYTDEHNAFITAFFYFVNFLLPVLCLLYNYCCLVRINK